MRLDKFLSQQLNISRTVAGREIRAKRVTVNGETAGNAAFRLHNGHYVEYAGEPLQNKAGPRYFMLNKPQGYVCSTNDPDHPCVLCFFGEPAVNKLHAAGRLDLDTTGLVLMTDDGQWSHHITSPRHHYEKTYLVILASPLTRDTERLFAKGVQLRNEKTLTRPAILHILGDKKGRLTLTEGRYHQVKRMFAAVGNHVVSLHRERIGEIALDNVLLPGEYRALTSAEISSVKVPVS